MVSVAGIVIPDALLYVLTLVILALTLFKIVRQKKQKMDLLMRKAEAEKYGLITKIEMVDGHTKLVTFSRQVETLNSKEYDAWKVRDNNRGKNYELYNLATETDRNADDVSDASFTEQRDSDRKIWNLDYGNSMEKHLKFSGNEQIGSGVSRIEVSDEEKLDLANRIKREGVLSGHVQISLTWDDFNDLDLYVITPGNEEISFRKRRSKCGGRMDVDMNQKPLSNTPIENVVWAKSPPEGTYKVLVHFHRHHIRGDSQPSTTFKLRVRVWGEEKHFTGTIQHGSPLHHVVSFSVEP
jgi:hypothetical protein